MGWPYWKHLEKKVAKEMGGKRVGILNSEDVQHKVFSFECKCIKRIPASIKGWMSQCKANNLDNKIPIIVLHEKGKHDDYVIMSYKDFRDLHGE